MTEMRDVHDPVDLLFTPTADTDGGACSPWAEAGRFHLVLANPRPLTTPIPFKGALGLRRLDEATIERIEAQL